MHKLCLLLLFCGSVPALQAQDSVVWATPNEKHKPIGRGLDINYTRIFSSRFKSEAKVDRLEDGEATLHSLDNIEYDLKLPIVLKERTKLLVGLEYTFDYYRFQNQEDLQYEFYSRLNKEGFKSRKLKFYFVHSLSSKNFISIRTSAALNGNVSESKQPIYRFAKYSLAFIYGWQKSLTNSYGMGIYLDYTFGRPFAYPVFEWNRSWSKKWGFEAKLPAKFKLRYTPNDGLCFYGGYQVEGISYRVVPVVEETGFLEEYEIRRSDIKLSLAVEKCLYDFIWMGFEAGIDYNIRVDAQDGGSLYNNTDLLKSQLEPAPFINLFVFLVPTESIKRLIKGK